MKVFLFFINSIFWLWLFTVPTGILSFLGFYLYQKNNGNLPYSIIIGIAGFLLGIMLAEYVRKNYGLDNFFGRISATHDIEDRNVPDNQTELDEKSVS